MTWKQKALAIAMACSTLALVAVAAGADWFGRDW